MRVTSVAPSVSEAWPSERRRLLEMHLKMRPASTLTAAMSPAPDSDTAQIRQLRAELGPAAIAKKLGIAHSSVSSRHPSDRPTGVAWLDALGEALTVVPIFPPRPT